MATTDTRILPESPTDTNDAEDIQQNDTTRGLARELDFLPHSEQRLAFLSMTAAGGQEAVNQHFNGSNGFVIVDHEGELRIRDQGDMLSRDDGETRARDEVQKPEPDLSMDPSARLEHILSGLAVSPTPEDVEAQLPKILGAILQQERRAVDVGFAVNEVPGLREMFVKAGQRGKDAVRTLSPKKMDEFFNPAISVFEYYVDEMAGRDTSYLRDTLTRMAEESGPESVRAFDRFFDTVEMLMEANPQMMRDYQSWARRYDTERETLRSMEQDIDSLMFEMRGPGADVVRQRYQEDMAFAR